MNPLGSGLPFLGNQVVTLPHDAVGSPHEHEPLQTAQVVECDRLSGAQGPAPCEPRVRPDKQDAHEDCDQGEIHGCHLATRLNEDIDEKGNNAQADDDKTYSEAGR